MRPAAEIFKASVKGTEPAVVLECGVFRGAHAAELYRGLKIKELYLLDRWRSKWEHYDKPEILDYAMQVFRLFDGMENVFIIRADALKYNGFVLGQFDFVYLDDNHTYEHVLAEMEKYYPLVSEGGVLAGDNYTPNGQVEQAVKEFCSRHKLEFDWKERKKAAADPNVSVGDWWIYKGG